ncbi:MAG TPA: DUF3667 domain-containing protein [Puia sp.]
MSHLHERKETNCLNCQTEVVGRYCHKCGQENLEPKETVWHLVQHFFNDITHFDGKFFDTVKYLIRRPGFLSLEYMRGRRMAYLNPIRMYVFTSAIFFIILFSLKKPEEMAKGLRQEKKSTELKTLADLRDDTTRYRQLAADADDKDDKEVYLDKLTYRKIEIATITKQYGDSAKQSFTRQNLDSIVAMAYTDSLAQGHIDLVKSKRFKKAIGSFSRQATEESDGNFNFLGSDVVYNNVEQYDSAEHALPDSLRDGWLKHFITKRGIIIKEEWHEDRRLFVEHLIENVFHSFPKILWVSLPIFAMILNILYFRRKKDFYYVNHGIFTIHVYCATFIQLFLFVVLYAIRGASAAKWLHTLIDLTNFAIFLWMLIYLYKAMRGFYGQRRAKTFVKYFIVMGSMFFINLFLLILFLMISVFSV